MSPSSADPAGRALEGELRQRLAPLKPQRLELVDETAAHAGHAGAQGGARHYRLLIVSPDFTGKSPLLRHRMICHAIGDLMRSRIHALSIQALAPGEGG